MCHLTWSFMSCILIGRTSFPVSESIRTSWSIFKIYSISWSVLGTCTRFCDGKEIVSIDRRLWNIDGTIPRGSISPVVPPSKSAPRRLFSPLKQFCRGVGQLQKRGEDFHFLVEIVPFSLCFQMPFFNRAITIQYSPKSLCVL